jgi:hypothetical protein
VKGLTMLASMLPLLVGCAESVDAETDAGADVGPRVPADLGELSGRGCAAGTVNLRSIEEIESFRPFCAVETLECVRGCEGGAPCEMACVEADPTPSPVIVGEVSGCASCFIVQRNACLTAACPGALAQLTCCIEDYPACGYDRGCSPCGDRWDVFEACRASADCLPLQEWCFEAP